MDPFKHFVRTEECSSSESGWTTYLASPMEEDFYCSEENYNSHHNIKDYVYDGEGNSDDSMVSDASSAPSHHQHNKHKDGQGSHGSKHNTSKHSSRREPKKEMKKSSENTGKSKKGLTGQAKSRK